MNMFLWLVPILQVTLAHKTFEIDNSIANEPQVVCESSTISLLFNTRNSFGGKIFVKGFASDNNCLQLGDGKTSHRFDIRHDSCGVRRQREANGVIVSTTVIVSFHSIFITKVDRAYRVSCFYVEASRKVHAQFDVSALTTQLLEGQTQIPVCRYEILSEPNGNPIRYAKVGDSIYHRWTCVSEVPDVYCMKVHSCNVNDGQGGPPVTVLDSNGCSVDGVILQNLDYTTDLQAGKTAPVFQFADKAGLYFNCQIQLTIKDPAYGCSTTQPLCSQQYVDATSRTTESQEYPTSSHESGYPTRPATVATTQGYAYISSPSPPPPEAFGDSASGKSNAYNRGLHPVYADIDSAAEKMDDVIEQQYNDTNPPFTTSAALTEGGVYSRLIKRATELSKPVTVADVDLPERGILVFGLEEDDTESPFKSSLSHMAKELNQQKTCFNTARVQLVLIVLFFLSTLLGVLLFVVAYRGRSMMSANFYKP